MFFNIYFRSCNHYCFFYWVSDPGGDLHTCHSAYKSSAFHVMQRVGFCPILPDLSFRTTIIHFSGLNTEPAILLHPASDSRRRGCPWISLMSCRLSFTHMGLPQIDYSMPKQASQTLLSDPFSLMPGQALQKGT